MPIDPRIYMQYANQMPRGEKTGMLNQFTGNYDQMRQRQIQMDEQARRDRIQQEQMKMNALRAKAFEREEATYQNALKQQDVQNQVSAAMQFGLEESGDASNYPGMSQQEIYRQAAISEMPQGASAASLQGLLPPDISAEKGPYSHLSADMQARLSTDPRVQKQVQLADAEKNKPAPRDESKVFDQELKLATKYETLSAPFIKQRDAYGRIQASAEDPSPAGDLSLIFNYMKVLDPGSVVRESEFRTAAGAKAALQNAQEGGEKVPNFIMGGINRLMTGQMLLANQRNDFANRAQRLFGKAQDQHKKRAKNFRKRAESYNLNADRVVSDLSLAVSGELGEMSDADLIGSF